MGESLQVSKTKQNKNQTMDRQQKFKLANESRLNAKDKGSHMIKLSEKEITSNWKVLTGCSLAFKEKRSCPVSCTSKLCTVGV